MIEKIHIKNFKSIYDLEIEVGRVNLFIGENGSGKSNLLEALVFVSASDSNKLDNEFLVSRGLRVPEPTLMRSAFKEENKNDEISIDIFFNKISLTIENFRATKNISAPELACLLGWLEKMYSSFERLLAIKENRTPRTLRIFLDWALVIGVLILSPQFATLGLYGIFTSFLIMCFLTILIKVQKILEYPFGKNMDHIDLRMRNKTFKRII